MVPEASKPIVLIVENSMDTTGAFKAILNYAHYAKVSYDFVFVLPRRSRLVGTVNQEGFKTETLPFVEIRKHPVNLLLYFPMLIINAIRLKGLVYRYRVGLVHVNDFYNLVGVAAKMLGGRFALLTHVRFMPDRFPALLVKVWMLLNLKYSKRIVCVSHAVKRCLTDYPNIQVIYDGLRQDISENTKVEREDDLIRLLYLGHYIPGKGQDFALEAFAKAYSQNPKLRLRFVGGNMGIKKNKVFREQLEGKAVKRNLREVVTFSGPASDVDKEFADADIALNFSESESFSFTCLEALAHGVPLIASDSGGPAELFEDSKSGILVPNRNVAKMAEAMLGLAKDDKRRKTYAQQGFHDVRYKFAESKTLEVLKEAYNQILP